MQSAADLLLLANAGLVALRLIGLLYSLLVIGFVIMVLVVLSRIRF